MESNHNVVLASVGEDNVWEFPPWRNSVGVRKTGNPYPKLAVTGNPGLKVGTPLVQETRPFSPALKALE